MASLRTGDLICTAPSKTGQNQPEMVENTPVMSTSTDRNQALRLLRGLEDGALSAAEARVVAADLDPVLVYVIVRYLREAYPASDPAATAVLDRVVQMTDGTIVRLSKEGEQDPISKWFTGEFRLGDFRGRGEEMIDLIVDKLES